MIASKAGTAGRPARNSAQVRKAGWRIDYFIVSRRIADRIRAAEIHNEIFGSDHCPVELQIDL